nr:nuclear transport factor 2 family protein [Mycolicibacterium baixiangningiae]
MTDLAELERRIARLEDERAISRLIASYGPLVDAGDAQAVGDLWTVDGSYDVEGWHQMGSRDDVETMVRSKAHQGLIANGSAHFLGPAVVTVDGDEAVAVCESALLVRRGDTVVVARIGANYFRLRRTEAGWQIASRTTRGLGGSPEARELLADGVAGRVR